MLSKEDYKKYLDQMYNIEIDMIGVYSECASLSGEAELKNIFLSLIDDERRHSRLVNSLKEFFE